MATGLLTTTLGQAAIATDLAGGADLVLTHVAFGDASGVPYTPNPAQTALVNEKYRSTISSVAVIAGAIVIDAIIPADTPDGSSRPSHSFAVAEAGIFSAAGTLIAVAQMSNGYKPAPGTGQASIATFRFKLAVSNPSAISVVIDPQAQINVGRHVRPFWMAVDGVLNAPPGSPATGATYVIGAAPTGAWAGFANRLAQWVGVWALATAPVGHVICDNSQAEDSSSRFMRRTASGWTSAVASSAAYGPVLISTPAEAIAGSSTVKTPNVDAMSEALQAGNLNWAVAGGTANAWTINPNRAASAYRDGRVLWVKAPATNTSSTVNADLSSLGNRRIKKADGSDPAIGDIIGGRWYPTIGEGSNICVVAALPSDWGSGEVPVQALPFPEVYTTDKLITMTSGPKAGQGGYILVNGGETVTLGRATAGGLGVSRRSLVPAADYGWTNANHLAVNSTYYLRGYLDADYKLTLYLQRGADSDAIPGGLLGTPGAATGGGFDSTKLDILLAKIVTGAAGATPTLERYANAALLTLVAARSTPALGSTTGTNTIWSSGGESVTVAGSGTVTWTLIFPLGWARKPTVVLVGGAYQVGGATAEQYVSGFANALSYGPITRSAITAAGVSDYSDGPVWNGATLRWTAHSGALQIVANV